MAKKRSRKTSHRRRRRGLRGMTAGVVSTCVRYKKGPKGKYRCAKTVASGPPRVGQRMTAKYKMSHGYGRRIPAKATVAVSREKAMVHSGPKKGRPRKGCRFTKGGAKCTAAVAASLR